MENVIIVFNNRNYTMQLATYLKRSGIMCKTIDTPREVTVSCGISIIINKVNLQRSKQILKASGIGETPRFYYILNNGMFKKYMPIWNYTLTIAFCMCYNYNKYIV